MKYDYIVLYSSRTGNTKKLATEIFAMLPGINKELHPLEEYRPEQETDVYVLGFWTNSGYPNPEMMDFLSDLREKKIIMFGTCGMGMDEEYYEELIRRAEMQIPDGNEYYGTFLCQGRMPISVRHKYEEMYAGAEDKDQVARLMHNFDQAMLHPNKEDFNQARLFINRVCEELEIPQEIEVR